MKIAYVAGPFRASNAWDIECNIRRAEETALEVWRVPGWCAICPHTNTRFFQGAAPDLVWLEGDIEILKRCDALVLAPNWAASSGTRAEVKIALDYRIPVYADIHQFRIGIETRPVALQAVLDKLK